MRRCCCHNSGEEAAAQLAARTSSSSPTSLSSSSPLPLRPHVASPSSGAAASSSLLPNNDESSSAAAAIKAGKAARGELSMLEYMSPVQSSDEPDPWPTPIKQPGYCTTYGVCDVSSQRIVNCRNNTKAIKPEFDITALCPQYTEGACCDAHQYNNLLTQVHHHI